MWYSGEEMFESPSRLPTLVLTQSSTCLAVHGPPDGLQMVRLINVKADDPMTSEVRLRDVARADLDIFFTQQLDPQANYMAAFTARDPANRSEFSAHWGDILRDDTITKKTILCDGQVAGSILCYPELGRLEVGYWIGKHYWGKGIATQALLGLLNEVKTRPLYARAAKDNVASVRVLEKCGFTIIGDDAGFSNARGYQVEEFVLRLGAEVV